jgi:hypothetical protein
MTPEAMEQLRQAFYLIAPGFLTLKIFQLFGSERKRSEWEWSVWSVLVSVLLDVFTKDPIVKLAAAAVLGFALVGAYRATLDRRLRRELVNSAWDHTLDITARAKMPVEVTIDDVRYFGRLRTFAREETGADLWLYLTDVSRDMGSGWKRLTRTEGVLVHERNVKLIRSIRRPENLDDPPVGAQ